MTASSMAHNAGKHPSAKEERKLRKPLIERKRRERINNCLDQLKETVIGAFRLDVNPTSGLEAQQKYSTGYIQCMHEVHNMLLTCDWMDKTLGSRLLNHLLKSLPRSNNERPPLSQPSPRHSVPAPAPAAPAPPPAGQGIPGTPLRGEAVAGRQLQKEGPACHVAGRQERAALHSSHLGILEMWRPW
ncbi:hypothetical protein INR49_032660 [Caranx melampygus]|nr:hypothetical protein INR49_032660 [Caranx melampygus]